jgi:cytochrome c
MAYLMRIAVWAALPLAISITASAEPDMRIVKGAALAREFCSQCHAVDRSDRSPHPSAPAFRSLERRLDNLDEFLDRLRQGLTSGHPDMPTFRFTRDDAQNMIAYLRSIQEPPSR